MPVMKITLSTAMRARDVSRPHAEHLAKAAEREEAVTRRPDEAAVPVPTPPTPADDPATSRRRRRRRL